MAAVPERRAALRVRALQERDLAAAAAASAAAFGVDLTVPAARDRWQARVAHGLATDPEGCFVAERDGAIVGVAEALLRGPVWFLSLLAVDPHGQSAGAGAALMERTLAYGGTDRPGIIVSSNDARALRLYSRSGFTLHPALEATGIPRSAGAAVGDPPVEVDGQPDFEDIDAIARDVRGAPYRSELAFALGRGARLLSVPGHGFAVVMPGAGPWSLLARDPASARALLRRALELCGDRAPVRVRWITAGQPWAVEVANEAGLSLTGAGALAVRGNPGPLACYLPSAPFG